MELEKGSNADLAVVAEVGLAFVRAIQEATYRVDPSLVVRVELISGTKGSLSLNTLVRLVKGKDLLSKKNLLVVLIISFAFLRREGMAWGFQEALNYLLGKQEVTLSDKDATEIAERAADAIEKRLAHKEYMNVFDKMKSDPAIKGFGIAQSHGGHPPFVIDLSRLPDTMAPSPEPQPAQRRNRVERQSIILTRPVLVEGNRRWGFRGKEGDFSVAMKDIEFQESLLDGRISITMRAGIIFDVDLQTTEEFEDETWIVKDRVVVKVHDTTEPPRQGRLFPPESPPNQ